MPLDIEMNQNNAEVKVFYSETIELVAAVYALREDREKSGEAAGEMDMEWVRAMYKKLTPSSMDTLRRITGFRLEGLEIMEFVLKEEIFDDIPLLLSKIEKYSDADFIYTFSGEEVSYEWILKIKKDPDQLAKLLAEDIPFAEGKPEGIKALFFDTDKFKSSMVKMLEQINNSLFTGKVASLKDLYTKEIDGLKKHLENQQPMEYAQEMMGRKFRKIFDFRDYLFIPSYFMNPKRIRFFNQHVQMIIFGVSREIDPISAMGDHLSEVLKVISDRTRIEILRELMVNGPSYGKLLADKLDLTTATISHHLEQLKDVGLVSENREKNIKYFSVNTDVLEKFFDESKKYFFNYKKKS